MMKKTLAITIIIGFMMFFAVGVLFFAGFAGAEVYAREISENAGDGRKTSGNKAPVVSEITAVNGVNFDRFAESGIISYEKGIYNPTLNLYGKDIVIHFAMNDAVSYRVDCELENGTVVTGTKQQTNEGSFIEYQVKQNGRVKVILNAWNRQGIELALTEQTVLSDRTEPQSYANFNEMKWQKPGTEFMVSMVLNTFNDSLSGKGLMRCRIQTESGIQVLDIDTTRDEFSMQISENTIIEVFYFDKAWNMKNVVEEYKKFDSVPPTRPEIVFTPNINPDFANGFVRYFTVEIRYGIDEGSGIKERTYIHNGIRKPYLGHFTISGAVDHTIQAFSLDNVDNQSSVAEKSVGLDKFDDHVPSVASLLINIDMTKAKPATVSIVASDRQSGIDYAMIEGTDIRFSPGPNNTFSTEFDCYGKTGLVVLIYDKAGNVSTNHATVGYFGDDALSGELKAVSAAFREVGQEEYTPVAWQSLTEAYARLSTNLMSDLTTTYDLNQSISNIYQMLTGANAHAYTIESISEYLSGLLKYKVETSDFVDYKKGDSVVLTLKESTKPLDFLAQSGFKNGFTDSFRLEILFRGESVQSLENGLFVSMNMPIGYLSREYALFDADTGEKIETALINNKIEFRLKKSSNLSLVIGGSKRADGTALQKKTISVFGNELSYGAFFGIIGGMTGAVGLAVVLLIIKLKRR